MTIRYRTSGAWGPGIGADLGPAHVDENFYTLNQRVQTVEDLPPPAAHIDYFTIVGDQLTVHMSDGSTLGPYTLPVVPLVFRGDWTPLTDYFAGEMFSHGSAIYQVLANHTSDTTFDPGENDGAGHDYYGFGLSMDGGLPTGGAAGMWLKKATSADFSVTWANSPLPAGGTTGQFLQKATSADYDVAWGDSPLPAGGATGQVLTKASATAYDTEWSDVASSSPGYPPNLLTTDITLAATHLNKFNMIDSTTDCTVNIAVEASWATGALSPGAMAHFRQVGAGFVIFSEDSGVTLNGIDGFENWTDKMGAVVTLYYEGSDVWCLYGLLAAS